MSKTGAVAWMVGLGLGLVVSSGGCARHVHHHHVPPAKTTKVVVLDQEHSDRSVVVVHKRPGAGRHCWQHKAHWHCRAR